jgi:hypothetical protein
LEATKEKAWLKTRNVTDSAQAVVRRDSVDVRDGVAVAVTDSWLFRMEGVRFRLTAYERANRPKGNRNWTTEVGLDGPARHDRPGLEDAPLPDEVIEEALATFRGRMTFVRPEPLARRNRLKEKAGG